MTPLLALLLAAAPLRAQTPQGSFPCAPADLARPPEVVLLAEDHNDSNAQELKGFAEQGAGQGRYFLGLEVIALERIGMKGPLSELDVERGFSPDAARLFGIEGSPATSFAYIWLVTSTKNAIPTDDERTFFAQIPKFPLLGEAFRRAAASQTLSPRAAFLARAAANAASPGDASRPAPFSLPQDVKAMDEAGARARVEAARLVREQENDPWVDSVLDRLDANADTGDIDLGYMLEVRNRDFAREIASLYCAAGREGKNLAIDLGREHAPGVAELLKSWSAGPLDIQTFDANDVDGGRQARALLGSW